MGRGYFSLTKGVFCCSPRGDCRAGETLEGGWLLSEADNYSLKYQSNYRQQSHSVCISGLHIFTHVYTCLHMHFLQKSWAFWIRQHCTICGHCGTTCHNLSVFYKPKFDFPRGLVDLWTFSCRKIHHLSMTKWIILHAAQSFWQCRLCLRVLWTHLHTANSQQYQICVCLRHIDDAYVDLVYSLWLVGPSWTVPDWFSWCCQSKYKIIHCVACKDSSLVPSDEVTAHHPQ